MSRIDDVIKSLKESNEPRLAATFNLTRKEWIQVFRAVQRVDRITADYFAFQFQTNAQIADDPAVEEFWCPQCGTGNDETPTDHTMDCLRKKD